MEESTFQLRKELRIKRSIKDNMLLKLSDITQMVHALGYGAVSVDHMDTLEEALGNMQRELKELS
jgi:hypothetical protein